MEDVGITGCDRGVDPLRPDTYWSIGFRTNRLAYVIKYVFLPLFVFFVGVICPLFLYAPELFSYSMYAKLSYASREAFLAKLSVALMIVSLPLAISVAMMIVGQIRRFHDFNRSGWLCILNIVPFAVIGILLLLCAVPGTKGPNKYGEDPRNKRKYEAVENQRN